MFLVSELSFIQKRVLEGLQCIGAAFNENKTSELHNSKILKGKKKIKNPSKVTPKLYI